MAFPTFKDLTELVKKGATLEAQNKIVELQESYLAVREENIALKEEIRSLRDNLNLKRKIFWRSPYYFTLDSDQENGPYCQHCYDDRAKLIRVQPGYESGAHRCPSCHEVV